MSLPHSPLSARRINFLLVLAVAAAIQAWTSGPAAALSITQVDGGPNYYAKFSNGLPAEKSFFPIGVWFESVLSQRDIDLDKDAGLNTYEVLTDDSDLNLIQSNGMHAILQGDNSDWKPATGKPFDGWLIGDEIDMTASSPSAGFSELQGTLNSLPADGRFRVANYGKGILYWNSDADASHYVNQFQQVFSADQYWFTDPWQIPDMPAQPWMPEGAGGASPILPVSQVRRAANYGYQIDRERQLDAMDGKRQPIWAVVEVGWPFTQTAAEGGRQIEPAEIRAAVWQSIIAGARGIIYFNHSFGGPNPTQHALRDPAYAPQRAVVKATNAQITQLAPVLNSPTVSSGWSQGPGTTATVKWATGGKAAGKRCKSKKKCKKAKGKKAAGKRCKSKKKCKKAKVHLYVFAGSRGSSAEGRFSLPCVDDAKAAVVGENRTVPVRNGSFRDDFADGNAVHIYRVDARSRCGKPRQGTLTPIALPHGDGPAEPSRINVFQVILAVLFIAMLASLGLTHRHRRAPRGSGKLAKRAHHLRMR